MVSTAWSKKGAIRRHTASVYNQCDPLLQGTYVVFGMQFYPPDALFALKG